MCAKFFSAMKPHETFEIFFDDPDQRAIATAAEHDFPAHAAASNAILGEIPLSVQA
jgi:hypothetical protein